MRYRDGLGWCCGTLLLLASACSRQEKPREAATPIQVAPQREKLVEVGEPAPSFVAVAHSGEKVSLSELRGKFVVLYFYPKDGTPGCTAEAEGFRDNHSTLKSAGAVVIGVSTQDNATHKEFAADLALPFLLIPDGEGELARSYGVGSFLGFTKRSTFIIDPEGKVARVYNDVSPDEHAQEVMGALAELNEQATPRSN